MRARKHSIVYRREFRFLYDETFYHRDRMGVLLLVRVVHRIANDIA